MAADEYDHECEVTTEDLDDLRREFGEQIEELRREIEQARESFDERLDGMED